MAHRIRDGSARESQMNSHSEKGFKTPHTAKIIFKKPAEELKIISETHCHRGFEVDADEVKKLEEERRKLLVEAKNLNHPFTNFSSTVIPDVLLSFNFWINSVIYTFLRLIIRYKWAEIPVISLTFMSTMGAFTSFFLVFFNNQAYSRFFSQYELSKKIEGIIFNIMLFSKELLPPSEAWRLFRYLNTVHLLGYVGFSPSYSEGNCFNPIIVSENLLTEPEKQRLKELGINSGGSCLYKEVLTWVMNLINTNFTDRTDLVRYELVNHILLLRGAIGGLFDYTDQPIPFVYLHALETTVLLYLPLCSYSIAVNMENLEGKFIPEFIGAFILILMTFFLLGIKSICFSLMDPFGLDSSDLSVLTYIKGGIVASRRVFFASNFQSQSLRFELALEKGRSSKGKGFE